MCKLRSPIDFTILGELLSQKLQPLGFIVRSTIKMLFANLIEDVVSMQLDVWFGQIEVEVDLSQFLNEGLSPLSIVSLFREGCVKKIAESLTWPR